MKMLSPAAAGSWCSSIYSVKALSEIKKSFEVKYVGSFSASLYYRVIDKDARVIFIS
jgi:hypothetical protein